MHISYIQAFQSSILLINYNQKLVIQFLFQIMQSKGSIKIFDGFYIGDQYSAQDQQYILLNHIEGIVNLSKNIPNHYQHHQIQYLNLCIKQNIDKNSLQQIFSIFREVKQNGASILICDDLTLDKPAAIGVIYIIFQWSLFKTLQFFTSRIQNLIFCPQTFQTLKNYELQMLSEYNKLSYNWSQKPKDEEQLVVRNTYLNSNDKEKKNAVSKPKQVINRDCEKRVTWDFSTKNQTSIIRPQTSITKTQSSNNLRNQILLNVRKILNDYKKNDNLDKSKIIQSTIRTNSSNLKSPPLKKHKSSFFIQSIQSLQRQQSMKLTNRQQILPEQKVTIDISLLKRDKTKTLPSEDNYFEQNNTQNSQKSIIVTQRYIQNVNSQSNSHKKVFHHNYHQKSNSLKTLNYRNNSKYKFNKQNQNKISFLKNRSNKLLSKKLKQQ